MKFSTIRIKNTDLSIRFFIFALLFFFILLSSNSFAAGKNFNDATATEVVSTGSATSLAATYSSSIDLQVVAFQTKNNGPTDNAVQVVTYIKSSAIFLADVKDYPITSASLTDIASGLRVSSGGGMSGGTMYSSLGALNGFLQSLGNFNTDDHFSSLMNNGAKSINVEYQITFMDDSVLEFDATLVLFVK